MKQVTYILLTFLILLGLSSTTTTITQMTDTRSVVKALYIYTFATLVEWPEEKRKGEFLIGVFGDTDGVYEELEKKYTGKSIGSQTIVLENYTNTSSVGDCHILYVSDDNSQHLKYLENKTINNNTLLVADKSGSLGRGAIVNFIVEGNQQKYEINKSNAKKHKLVIADKLSDLAARVIK